MNYYIITEDDYPGHDFEIEAVKINSYDINSAIEKFMREYCRMYDNGEKIKVYVSENDPKGLLLLKFIGS